MDSDFESWATPGARMVWSDAEAAWVDPNSKATPKDYGAGWMRQRGIAAFVANRAGALVIEIVRVTFEEGLPNGRFAVFDAATAGALQGDMSFRMTPAGNEVFRNVRASLQGWKVVWIGPGATTPAVIITRHVNGVRSWAFGRVGPAKTFIEIDRGVSLEQLIMRAAEPRAAA